MAFEIGSMVDGRVTGLARFGAFVELPEGQVGLIHISEIADEYVTEVSQYLKVGDPVKVKVLGMAKAGKYDLSLKRTKGEPERKKEARVPSSLEEKITLFLKQSEERLSDLKRNLQEKQGEARKKKK